MTKKEAIKIVEQVKKMKDLALEEMNGKKEYWEISSIYNKFYGYQTAFKFVLKDSKFNKEYEEIVLCFSGFYEAYKVKYEEIKWKAKG